MAQEPFKERNLSTVPIRDLGLVIEGTPLASVVAGFEESVRAAGVTRVRARFYLSTEWGVPFGTVAVGIPFYLARPELKAVHEEQTGHVEGLNEADILRYLRHEFGHVVNYAYRLYEEEEWVRQFGSITQPYLEEYRPQPFSKRFVRHLPGWYAQKHPDEDWAETFAIWLTPGADWRAEYATRPTALAKLAYCDETMKSLADRDPPVTEAELHEDVTELTDSVEQYYRNLAEDDGEFPPGLGGALRTIFEDLGEAEGETGDRKPAAALIRRLERHLVVDVFRWTGHFPERTRTLVRHLAERAEELAQVYPSSQEVQASVGITTLVAALAMNHVHKGTYLP